MIDSNNFNYTVIDSSTVKYKELHNSLFKGAATSYEWINWYHKDLSSSLNIDTITYAAFDGDILIGIWSVEPKLMHYEGNDIKVGRCFAVGIHEGYRRLGLFVSLSEFAIQSERLRGEFEYIIGFPQKGRSVIGGHLKAGWEHVQEIGIYSAAQLENDPTFPYSNIEIIQNFNILDIPTNINGSLIENPKYKNTRWLQHPDLHYICLKYGNAFLVLKAYANFCHIVDINGDKDDVLYLLKTAKVLGCRHGWAEINVWCAENEFFVNEIKNAGFIEGANFGLPISMIAVKINAITPLVFKTCHIQMGVEEGY